MLIKNVEDIELQEFTTCFNEAFSDYVIPFQVSAQHLADKFAGAGVNYQMSFGAFDQDKQVAFVMHGIGERNGERTAFNTGTGVVPLYRGKRLVAQIYRHAFPILKEANIQKCLLEVIQTNVKAIKAYSALGFQIHRELVCFKGRINVNLPADHRRTFISMVRLEEFDWTSVHAYWNFEPSWEQSAEAILRNPHLYDVVTIMEDNKICGYAVIKSANGAVLQFGVLREKRNQGLGRSLFHWIGERHALITVNNVDKRDINSIRFLKEVGLDVFIEQYEMKKDLS
ncbi:GNAT family N-acetyltransferase [Paenibacillus sp. FSL K6-2859]|uniref:GNAT family N-acetyltransferase n=1 Tax=Paenibacillus sp. FSL K6-2859 TaxID=2921482 RepID=UPI0030FAF51E